MARTAVKRKSSTQADEDQLVHLVVKKMENQFGSRSALIPDSGTILCQIDHWVSTRNFLIDSAIAGGLPMPRPIIPFGRLTEIAGLNGTGKTTLLGQIIAETQATGGIAAVIDTEQSIDLSYFEKLGVNLSRLIVIQCETIEDVFTRLVSLVEAIKEFSTDRLICMGWDSLGGTPTKAQATAEADDHFYAEAAKVVGKNLQRLIQMISRERIALVFNNHLYRKMNVKYGDPWETYGGEKVKFYSTLRIRLERVGAIGEGIKDKDEEKVIIGHRVKVKVIKNKMAPMLRSVVVPCIGNHGFSLNYSVFEHSIQQGLITGKTWRSWSTSSEEVKFLGWKGFQEKVMVHPEYPDLVQQVVSNHYHKNSVAGEVETEVEDEE